MVLSTEQAKIQALLQETITLLCKNGLEYKEEFSVEALIGVTLDRDKVLLLSVKETVQTSKDGILGDCKSVASLDETVESLTDKDQEPERSFAGHGTSNKRLHESDPDVADEGSSSDTDLPENPDGGESSDESPMKRLKYDHPNSVNESNWDGDPNDKEDSECVMIKQEADENALEDGYDGYLSGDPDAAPNAADADNSGIAMDFPKILHGENSEQFSCSFDSDIPGVGWPGEVANVQQQGQSLALRHPSTLASATQVSSNSTRTPQVLLFQISPAIPKMEIISTDLLLLVCRKFVASVKLTCNFSHSKIANMILPVVYNDVIYIIKRCNGFAVVCFRHRFQSPRSLPLLYRDSCRR